MLETMFYIHSSSLLAATSTRFGGVSLPPFDSLNLAFQTDDQPSHVLTNRQIFLKALSIEPQRCVYTHQTHSTTLVKVSSLDAGKGFDRFESGVKADALYTTEKNLPLAVFHADCAPVFLYTKDHTLACIIHAGKEGSLHHITLRTIQTIIEKEGVDPKNLMAHIGPSLDFSYHPISLEEVDKILSMNNNFSQVIKLISGIFYLDIPLLNYMQLIDAGIPLEQIHVSNIDTYSDPQRFFSYQREAITGRHVSLIMLQ
jgi:YfiH family protein